MALPPEGSTPDPVWSAPPPPSAATRGRAAPTHPVTSGHGADVLALGKSDGTARSTGVSSDDDVRGPSSPCARRWARSWWARRARSPGSSPPCS